MEPWLTVEERDAKLRELGLQTNSQMRDSEPMDAKEESVKEQIGEMLGDKMKQSPDDILLRTIRGYWSYKDQIKDTADGLQQILQWRGEHNVDTLLQREVEYEEEVLASWPSVVYGQDYQGHILNCERLADIDTDKLGSMELRHVLLARAKAAEMIELLKKQVSADIGMCRYKHSFIIDLTGLSLSKHFSGKTRELLKPVFGQASANYPESLWKLYVINAPFVFRTVWSIIKMWLDPQTQKKIYILGGKSTYLKELEKSGFPLDQIPDWAGGTHQGQDMAELLRRHRETPIFTPGPMSNAFRPAGTAGPGAAGAGAGAGAGGAKAATSSRPNLDLKMPNMGTPSAGSGPAARGRGPLRPYVPCPNDRLNNYPTDQLTVGKARVHSYNDKYYKAMRDAFGVSEICEQSWQEFSFDSDLREGGGKGGNLMGFTKDRRFIIKEMNDGDHKALLKVTDEYVKHVLPPEGSNESMSIICRFYAHFKNLKYKGGMNFVVMNNWLPPLPESITSSPSVEGCNTSTIKAEYEKRKSSWDLKGTADDKTLYHDGKKVQEVHKRIWNVTMWGGQCMWSPERKNYKEKKTEAYNLSFHVSEEQQRWIGLRIRYDCEWLIEMGLMDYSLIVGESILPKHMNKVGVAIAGTSDNNTQPLVSVNRYDGGSVQVLSVGIIDFLQEYGMGKVIANKIKAFEKNKSTVPPRQYGQRFMKYFDYKFSADALTLEPDGSIRPPGSAPAAYRNGSPGLTPMEKGEKGSFDNGTKSGAGAPSSAPSPGGQRKQVVSSSRSVSAGGGGGGGGGGASTSSRSRVASNDSSEKGGWSALALPWYLNILVILLVFVIGRYNDAIIGSIQDTSIGGVLTLPLTYMSSVGSGFGTQVYQRVGDAFSWALGGQDQHQSA
jgi:hypothetical protein